MTRPLPPRPDGLPERTQVAVIGGGIAGVATAYFLAKSGVPVALFEKGRIAGEQSSRNWGWVRKQSRDPREMPAILESLRVWETMEEEIGADVGWCRAGVAIAADTDEDMARHELWLETARQYGLDTQLLNAGQTDELLGQSGRRWKGALYTASDGRAEPAKAVPALAQAAEQLGARIFEGCAVRAIETEAGRVSGIVTEWGPVACQQVVCAAGVWSELFNRNLGVKMPQLGLAVSVMRTKPLPEEIAPAFMSGTIAIRRRQDGGYTIARGCAGRFNLVPEVFRYLGHFWPAMRKSYKYVELELGREFFRRVSRPARWAPDQVSPFEKTRVLAPDPDLDLLDRAMAEARDSFPQLAKAEIAESWAGMIDVTPDALPVISEVEERPGYYILTGLSGHGFGMGPGAGLLMSELITKGEARVDLSDFRHGRFSDGTKMEPFAPF